MDGTPNSCALRASGNGSTVSTFTLTVPFTIRPANRRQLIYVRLLADEKSFGFRSLVFGRS